MSSIVEMENATYTEDLQKNGHPRILISGRDAEQADPDTATEYVEDPCRKWHDPSLVRIVEQKKKLDGCTFNLTTPFAGKPFFDDFMRGLSRLPLNEAHFIWYDNSNSEEYRAMLKSALDSVAPSYTLIEDGNKSLTIESTDDYGPISARCHKIYKYIMEGCTEESLGYTLNIEDDVEIPANVSRLWNVLDTYPKVGTVVGSCSSRRSKGSYWKIPIAFTFRRVQTIGGDFECQVSDHRIVTAKEFGLEAVGAAHMGCWLTRTRLLREVGMHFGTDGVRGQDLCWGYELNLAGWTFAIDWSVCTKHYFMEYGEKRYLT